MQTTFGCFKTKACDEYNCGIFSKIEERERCRKKGTSVLSWIRFSALRPSVSNGCVKERGSPKSHKSKRVGEYGIRTKSDPLSLSDVFNWRSFSKIPFQKISFFKIYFSKFVFFKSWLICIFNKEKFHKKTKSHIP